MPWPAPGNVTRVTISGLASAMRRLMYSGTKVPILLIHGEEDRFVPEYMSRRIADANPEMVTRVTFPGAGHGISYLMDEERYKKITGDFLEKIFA